MAAATDLDSAFSPPKAGHYCLGEGTPRSLTKHTIASCLSTCRHARADCACVAYREPRSQDDENCRLVAANAWRGTTKSRSGFDAYVRVGAEQTTRRSTTPPSVAPTTLSHLAATAAPECTAKSIASTLLTAASNDGASGFVEGTPPFYLYRAEYDPSALAECYARGHAHRAWNFSADVAAWVESALSKHPARVESPDKAQTILLPTFAALSAAAGTCGGASHFGRMVATSEALKALPWFQTRPYDVLLLNGVAVATKNPLGELGQTVASRGGRAACLDTKWCGFFAAADKAFALPPVGAAGLLASAVRASVDEEACTGRRPPTLPSYGTRSVRVYFRGGFGTSKEAQELRARLPLLRQISGGGSSQVQVTMVGSDRLVPSAAHFLSAHQLSATRLKRLEGDSYVRAMMRAKFCLVPAGDGAAPGPRLVDAIAAGCVPILVGVDKRALPFHRSVAYTRFAGFISRTSFLKDPVYACEAMLHKLEPQLGAMRRALMGARRLLLYGTSDNGPYDSLGPFNASARVDFGEVAPLLLREHRLAIYAPPSTHASSSSPFV